MLRKILLATTGAMMLYSPVSVLAADAAAGKDLYTQKGCPACHGPSGESTNPAMFPVLAGQSAAYISEQLHAFKSGERQGQGPGVIMNQVTKTLSDDDIESIAAFIESLK